MNEQLPAEEKIKTDMRVSMRWTGHGFEVKNLETAKPVDPPEESDPRNHKGEGGQSEILQGNPEYKKRKENWDREHRNPLDQLTDALTLEEFDEACDHLGTRQVDIGGHRLSGQFIKENVERARELIVQKQTVAAARALEVIPDGPLIENIEALLHQNGLRRDMRELRRASGR